MKLIGSTEHKPTAKDRKVAERWPGAWIGFYVARGRVTSRKAGRQYAYELAKHGAQQCDFPVIVLYRGADKWMEIPGGSFYDPVGPNDMWCMWPATCNAGQLLFVIRGMLESPHIGHGLIHHTVRQEMWEDGLLKRYGELQKITDAFRSNWS